MPPQEGFSLMPPPLVPPLPMRALPVVSYQVLASRSLVFDRPPRPFWRNHPLDQSPDRVIVER